MTPFSGGHGHNAYGSHATRPFGRTGTPMNTNCRKVVPAAVAEGARGIHHHNAPGPPLGVNRSLDMTELPRLVMALSVFLLIHGALVCQSDQIKNTSEDIDFEIGDRKT